MKTLFTFYLIFFLLIFSQLKSNSIKDTIDINKTEQNAYFNEIKNKILDERLTQSSETINNLNSMISGFSVIYTTITILIALLGISLPILTYFFSIKPSQKAIKDLEHNINLKIKTYLQENKNEQINTAIENLKSNDNVVKNSAISFLSLTQHEGFSEFQTFNIIKILSNPNIESSTYLSLVNLLINKESDFATDFFKKEFIKKDNLKIKYPAVKYFCLTGFQNYFDTLKIMLENYDGTKYAELAVIYSWAIGINKQEAIKLLNEKKIIDFIEPEQIISLYSIVEGSLKNDQLTEIELSETYLTKKYMNKNDVK